MIWFDLKSNYDKNKLLGHNVYYSNNNNIIKVDIAYTKTKKNKKY